MSLLKWVKFSQRHRFYTIWTWYGKGDFTYADPSNDDLDMIEGASIIGIFSFFLKVDYSAENLNVTEYNEIRSKLNKNVITELNHA